jgi:outer membrane lipopolysaccharide assembly protein LptE/RlpB
MKKLLLVGLVALLQGCATFSFQNIKDQIPSFWDDNQSRSVIDIRQSVEKLNCKELHAPQVKVIKDNIQWFILYSDSKGTKDVLTLVKPMESTVDDFYKRSLEKQGTEIYCDIKKKILTTQSSAVAKTVIGRF